MFDWITLKFGTVYPAIYCLKYFDIINNVTYRWMMCDFMQLAMLQFEMRLQKCIRMGINIFKFSSGEVYL